MEKETMMIIMGIGAVFYLISYSGQIMEMTDDRIKGNEFWKFRFIGVILSGILILALAFFCGVLYMEIQN